MRLVDVIHEETGAPLDKIVLLRHLNRIDRLIELGGSVEEFTYLQPTGTKWDFWANGKPPAEVVVVIVHDHVFGVYRVLGVEAEGTLKSLASEAHRQFDMEDDRWKADRPARRFSLLSIPSIACGRAVKGWAGREIVPIVRNSAPLFSTVQVDLSSDVITLSDQDAGSDSLTGKEYVPQQDVDRRRMLERQIRERRGQQQFRDALRARYGDRCLVTGCGFLAVLEAAHINPYRGEDDNHPANGLLLRGDIHTMFDLDLLGIEPDRLLIELHPTLVGNNQYGKLAGKTLRCPNKQRPSGIALGVRYERFLKRIERRV